MLNDKPIDGKYTQYQINYKEDKHVFSKELGSSLSCIYHVLYQRLYLKNFSVKIESTPTFFGEKYFAYKDTNNYVYVGVLNV